MAINNRSLDASEQKFEIQTSANVPGTGTAIYSALVPYPCTLTDIRVGIAGLSGTPTYTFSVGRFYPGAGFSAQAVTGALTGVAVGTSGIQRASLLAAGSTLLDLQAGDVLICTTGGTNADAASIAISYVAQATQEIKSHFGVIAS